MKKNDEYEQLFDGARFILDKDEELMLSCCDCGQTHLLKFKILKNGRISVKMSKEDNEGRRMRRNNKYRFKYK